MNIKQAKQEIIHTLKAYHHKDENGEYIFPVRMQRPILLMGPPGIGKTAIMEQIAEECNVGLVSYTITHHTRQSAVGLPEIIHKKYGGKDYSVTEYTMSEIVGAVYECIEKTGKEEGILFIDEINCVSETLTPTMLQFLQKKTFGTHVIPKGYIIVAAGNPVQYNRTAREFDIVTMDRVRRIEVEADLDAWMAYASNIGVHGSVLSYLNMKQDDFYHIDLNDERDHFVTARGWEDLAQLIRSYEELGLFITKDQIVQFIQKEEIAEQFYDYYQLYRKYQDDYEIMSLLNGSLEERVRQEKIELALLASWQERMMVTGLVLDVLMQMFRRYDFVDRCTVRLHENLTYLIRELSKSGQDCKKDENDPLSNFVDRQKEALNIKVKMGTVSENTMKEERYVISQLSRYFLELRKYHLVTPEDRIMKIKEMFQVQVKEGEELVRRCDTALDQGIMWLEEAFGNGSELLMLISGILGHRAAMDYISTHGNDRFLRCADQLVNRGQTDILQDECRNVLNGSF